MSLLVLLPINDIPGAVAQSFRFLNSCPVMSLLEVLPVMSFVELLPSRATPGVVTKS